MIWYKHLGLIYAAIIVVFVMAWGCRREDRLIHGGLAPLLEAIAEANVEVEQIGLLMVEAIAEDNVNFEEELGLLMAGGGGENLTSKEASIEMSRLPDVVGGSLIGFRVDVESNDSLKRLSDSIENQGGWTPQCWVYVSQDGYRYARMNVDFSHRGRRSDGDLYVVLMLWFLEGDYALFVDEKIGPFDPDHIEVADDKIRHITGEEWGTYWIGRNVVFIHRVDNRRRR